MIGSDGGLLPQATEVSSLRMAPSERYEVVIDFSRYPIGSRVYLLNCLQQLSGRGPEQINMDSCTPLVEFRIERDEADPSTIPDDLNPGVAQYISEHLTERPGLQVQNVAINLNRGNGAWQINERFYDPNRVDVVERLWTHSTWTLTNLSGGWSHPLHIHDEEFRSSRATATPRRRTKRGSRTSSTWANDTVRVAAYWTGEEHRQIRVPLPQPGARGHAHDGNFKVVP